MKRNVKTGRYKIHTRTLHLILSLTLLRNKTAKSEKEHNMESNKPKHHTLNASNVNNTAP